MIQASNNWGVEINGADEDKNVWRALLKPPFDPFVEEVTAENGSYWALRSSVFDKATSPADVDKIAEQLFRTLNVVMSTNADSGPLKTGAVVEFRENGETKRHRFLKVQTRAIKVRGGLAEFPMKDAQGNAIKVPPTLSRAQLWMRAVILEPEIGTALGYLEGKSSWMDLYKAFEAIKDMENGELSKNEIERFRRTANAEERHHPNDKKHKPHPRPMEIWEARSFITKWLSAAIDETLATNPSTPRFPSKRTDRS